MQVHTAVRQALVARSPFRLDDSGELPIATALETAFRRYDPASRQLPSSTSELAAHGGTVSFLEFERSLLSIGVRLTDREVAEVVTDLGIERSGRIRYMGALAGQTLRSLLIHFHTSTPAASWRLTSLL